MQKINNRALNYYGAYEKEVFHIFSDFEPVRLDTLNKFKKKSFLKYLLPLIISLILAMYIGYLECFDISTIIIYVMTIFPIFLLQILYYYNARKKENIKFTKMIKILALQRLLKVFGDIRWMGHDPNKENITNALLENYELNKSGLFISYNTRYTDDEFEGTHEGVPFKISETKMYDISGSGKNCISICAFEGIILSFKCNKTIHNRTIVATKGDLTKKNQTYITMLICLPGCCEFFKDGYAHWKLVSVLIILLVIFFVAKSFEKKEEALNEVTLEDPKFAKRFNVYSSDQVEARYLVTTAFMHRFYNLQTAFGAKKAKCSFYGNTLMIAINTDKNLFEIGSLFKSLRDPSSINEFYRELDSIFKIIEYFKLNEKTGL